MAPDRTRSGSRRRRPRSARRDPARPDRRNPCETFKYHYDFGDDWLYTIRIERLIPADPALTYPRLLAAEGCCPPEDVGGPPGYARFLEILTDPTRAQHAEMREWHGEEFDPHRIDVDAIAAALTRLAADWQREQTRRRSRKSR